MNVHGSMFKTPYTPITPENIRCAKTDWRKSAPGCDGVLAPKVARYNDDALTILFNLILASPLEWMLLRIPGAGSCFYNDRISVPINCGRLFLSHLKFIFSILSFIASYRIGRNKMPPLVPKTGRQEAGHELNTHHHRVWRTKARTASPHIQGDRRCRPEEEPTGLFLFCSTSCCSKTCNPPHGRPFELRWYRRRAVA